jgi:hypothetical protein
MKCSIEVVVPCQVYASSEDETPKIDGISAWWKEI